MKIDSPVKKASAVYAFCLFAGSFFINPIPGAAATLWILAAAPLTPLFLRKEQVQTCIKWAFAVLSVYALGLIAQEIIDVRYTGGWAPHSGRSWPVLDSNNAAAILNFALLGSLYGSLKHPKNLPLMLAVPLFSVAMLLTNSRTGMITALAGIAFILILTHGRKVLFPVANVIASTLLAAHYAFQNEIQTAFSSLLDRLTIWEPCYQLLSWLGYGLGSFGYLYNQVRIEPLSAGYYAHNDLIQLWIEGGFITFLSFVGLMLSVLFTTRRGNAITACILGVIFVQSLIEFQFYVPAVSLLAGLALAYHASGSSGDGRRKGTFA